MSRITKETKDTRLVINPRISFRTSFNYLNVIFLYESDSLFLSLSLAHICLLPQFTHTGAFARNRPVCTRATPCSTYA